MNKLTSPFREGIMEAERIHEFFTKKTLNALMQKATKSYSKKFTDVQLNFAGIYSMVRSYKLSESAKDGIRTSRLAVEESLKKDINSYKKGRDLSAKEKLDFLNNLFKGVDPDNYPDNIAEILEKNASELLPPSLIEYVKGVNEMFEVTKPLAKFSSEFSFGMPFEEWVNYTPWFSVKREGYQPEDDVNLVDITQSSDDIALSFDKDTKMNSSGNMGSLEAKTRRLGESRVYVYNINYLAENRMRLNLLDYLTINQRRELNNVISGKGTVHKKFVNLLGDSGGKKGRTALMQYAIGRMWRNSVQSASFVAPMQGFVNTITNLWASTKLSSFYQWPAHVASNLTPFFVVNANNPEKIKYLFEAYGILIKKWAGVPLDGRISKTIDRLDEIIKSRSQEQFLDKSISLEINSSDLWQKIKSSPIYSGLQDINNLREKLLFAPFKFSDIHSGLPMMLAEIRYLEQVDKRSFDWDSLSPSSSNLIKALDEIERFIGIGASSRRSYYTDTKNGYVSVIRNMISSFSSHRINNATNFKQELRRFTSSNLSQDEKMKSMRYMLGIAAQSVVFTGIKTFLLSSFYSIISDFLGEDENEEELNKEYAKLVSGGGSAADKKIIRAEISMREKIRKEYQRVKDRQNSNRILFITLGKDILSNAFLIPAASNIPLDMLLIPMDQHHSELFNKQKDEKLSILSKRLKAAKDIGNKRAELDLIKQIARIEGQEPLLMSPTVPNQVDFGGGLYGGVAEDAARALSAASSSLIKVEAPQLSEVFGGLGVIGLNQPDFNKFIRLYSKREKYEKELEENIKKIKSSR